MNIHEYVLPDMLDRCIVALEHQSSLDWHIICALTHQINGNIKTTHEPTYMTMMKGPYYIWIFMHPLSSFITLAMSNTMTKDGYALCIGLDDYTCSEHVREFWSKLIELWS